jgi:hypothetical protein
MLLIKGNIQGSDRSHNFAAEAMAYLQTKVRALVDDLRHATTELGGLGSADGARLEACCFRWAGGGVSPSPQVRLSGYLADSMRRSWGPHTLQNGGNSVVNSAMQQVSISLSLPARLSTVGSSGADAWDDLTDVFYTLDGTTPNTTTDSAQPLVEVGGRDVGGHYYEEGGNGVRLYRGGTLVLTDELYAGVALTEPKLVVSKRRGSSADAAGSDPGTVMWGGQELPQVWIDSELTRVEFTLSPVPEPLLSPVAITTLTTTTSVMVASALTASVSASVASSLASVGAAGLETGMAAGSAGSAGGASGGLVGDPMSIIDQVQFMAVSGALSLPLPIEYREFTAGFAWINLQARPPGARLGDVPTDPMDPIAPTGGRGGGEGGEAGEGGGRSEGGSRMRGRQRRRLLTNETGDSLEAYLAGISNRNTSIDRSGGSALDDDGETVASATPEANSLADEDINGMMLLLLLLGFSSEELFLGECKK